MRFTPSARRFSILLTGLATATVSTFAGVSTASSSPPLSSPFSGSASPAVVSPDSNKTGGKQCPQLTLADDWYGDNAERIQRVIDENGRCRWRHGRPPKARPYAVFDSITP